MKVGNAEVMREWLERRRALLTQERGATDDGRGKPEKHVSRRIERLRSLAGGFSMMQTANGVQME